MTRNDTETNDEAHETTTKRLENLRDSARTLQREINAITREIRALEIELGSVEKEENRESTTEENKLRVGQRIQFNKKAGKPLKPSAAHNPRGTIISITEQWIHFRTDDGDIKYRAPKNIATID